MNKINTLVAVKQYADEHNLKFLLEENKDIIKDNVIRVCIFNEITCVSFNEIVCYFNKTTTKKELLSFFSLGTRKHCVKCKSFKNQEHFICLRCKAEICNECRHKIVIRQLRQRIQKNKILDTEEYFKFFISFYDPKCFKCKN